MEKPTKGCVLWLTGLDSKIKRWCKEHPEEFPGRKRDVINEIVDHASQTGEVIIRHYDLCQVVVTRENRQKNIVVVGSRSFHKGALESLLSPHMENVVIFLSAPQNLGKCDLIAECTRNNLSFVTMPLPTLDYEPVTNTGFELPAELTMQQMVVLGDINININTEKKSRAFGELIKELGIKIVKELPWCAITKLFCGSFFG